MCNRTTSRRVFLGSLEAVLLAVLAGGCAERDRHRGQRLLLEKRKEMRTGMSVDEVDILMRDHPRHASQGEYDSVEGRELPRLSTFIVTYGDHVGAGEGSYGLTAFFDKDGKLLDTSIGEYSN